MSDAIPVLPRPSLAYYENLARDLQHACRAHDPAAIRAWAARWIEQVAGLCADDIASEAIGDESDRLMLRWKKWHKAHPRCLTAPAGRIARSGQTITL